jgi:hypothetical protein
MGIFLILGQTPPVPHRTTLRLCRNIEYIVATVGRAIDSQYIAIVAMI